jgi:hypothetical protein
MMTQREVDEFTARMKACGKPSKIAASFSKVTDLEEHHIRHFKTASYFWKPMNGGIWGGMLVDESLDYIHLVLASEDVVKVLLDNKELDKLLVVKNN